MPAHVFKATKIFEIRVRVVAGSQKMEGLKKHLQGKKFFDNHIICS
jgi:hypothetical protein